MEMASRHEMAPVGECRYNFKCPIGKSRYRYLQDAATAAVAMRLVMLSLPLQLLKIGKSRRSPEMIAACILAVVVVGDARHLDVRVFIDFMVGVSNLHL
jgi:hypothetical protein